MGTPHSGLVFKYAELTERAARKDNGTFAGSLTERFSYGKGEARSVICESRSDVLLSVSRVATFCYL